MTQYIKCSGCGQRTFPVSDCGMFDGVCGPCEGRANMSLEELLAEKVRELTREDHAAAMLSQTAGSSTLASGASSGTSGASQT